MRQKQTYLLRLYGNSSAPSQESDVDNEGPIISKNVKGHITGIVESHHSNPSLSRDRRINMPIIIKKKFADSCIRLLADRIFALE